MENLILQLCNKYYVSVISSKQINIIAHHHSDLKDIEDTYDSLELVKSYSNDNLVTGIFEFTN